ncbi:BrnA antitoxin family protein [Jannaschia seohaensis]|uniref:BrnA antitoxin of type II toxin-antitoxin system n=1 Tax=Jannaschia seohaensis TaxID=475081 RepID=A0A2Y9AVK0_9RHOB|nr:BrnA antitoxin family protein [Jannaschia seohaensis]PWJ17014.1 BrnA antitoxin of type II toxin-antitoxin system [Jannaschia seohaensis]SSA48351.1 BrnA antitoxin of type II toxin-antitoxin system [Jannaschia seohaensis]
MGQTKAQRARMHDMFAMMERFEWDLSRAATREARVPEEWREVWQTRSRKKQKLSFWVDADVVTFFRSLGPGYGPRMNTVLRAFMLARLAGLLEGEDLPEAYRERWMGKPKPSVAEARAMYEGME